MEQLYLTRVNNLTAAWPSVYNRIDKHQVQVMKFQRKPQGGKLSSPALRVRALLVSVCVDMCALLIVCLLLHGMQLGLEYLCVCSTCVRAKGSASTKWQRSEIGTSSTSESCSLMS